MEENERTLYENLEYLNETKGIIKQAIIDKGVEVSADTPFREYADKIGDIQGGSGDLDDVITAQEQYIEELEAIIDEKASGGGDGSSMNIFVQTTEPSIKKGLWLQTNETVNNIYGEYDISENAGWVDYVFKDLSGQYYSTSGVIIDNFIYLFGGGGTDNCIKYDIINQTQVSISSPPHNMYGCVISCIGTDIYLFGGGSVPAEAVSAYKYDTLTDTYIKLANIPTDAYVCMTCVIGDDIYIFGCGSRW